MPESLRGLKVAILVENGFEEVELSEPKAALEQAGAQTFIVSPQRGEVKSWAKTDWGKSYPVDLSLHEAKAEDFDALLLPGGVLNPDRLRMQQTAVALVKQFNKQEKPIAAICHGPWMLVEANIIQGKTVTSWPSLQTDIRNAGARWIDQETVVEGNLLTSRNPNDIPAFNQHMLTLFAKRQSALQP
jgi:protease I